MNSQSALLNEGIILKLKLRGDLFAREALKEGCCCHSSLLLSAVAPTPKRHRQLEGPNRTGREGRELGLTGAHFQILHAVQQRVLLHLGLCQCHFGSGQLQFQTFVLLLQHLKMRNQQAPRGGAVDKFKGDILRSFYAS